MQTAAAVLLLLASSTVYASQPLETETARLLPQGVFKIEEPQQVHIQHRLIQLVN